MRTVSLAALLPALLIAGCSVKPMVPTVPPQEPAQPPTPAPTVAAPAVKSVEPSVVARTEPAAPPAPAPSAESVQTESKVAKTPAKAAAPAAKTSAKKEVAQEPAKKEAAPEPAKSSEPPLDIASLETRLKDTRAIGLMTKIALKNQVDDLLNQFRGFYSGKIKTTLADLRRAYDLLVLKVLSLLQDSDPALATAIVASREAIWGILSDRVKFTNFATS